MYFPYNRHAELSPFCYPTYGGFLVVQGRTVCPCGWMENIPTPQRRTTQQVYQATAAHARLVSHTATVDVCVGCRGVFSTNEDRYYSALQDARSTDILCQDCSEWEAELIDIAAERGDRLPYILDYYHEPMEESEHVSSRTTTSDS